jgi:hypothetical protein
VPRRRADILPTRVNERVFGPNYTVVSSAGPEVCMLDNRELANLLWVAAGVVVCGACATTRPAALGLVRAALDPKLVAPVLMMVAVVVGLVRAGSSVGLWAPDLLVPTVI